jgi:hypothetical protein
MNAGHVQCTEYNVKLYKRIAVIESPYRLIKYLSWIKIPFLCVIIARGKKTSFGVKARVKTTFCVHWIHSDLYTAPPLPPPGPVCPVRSGANWPILRPHKSKRAE